MIAQKLGDGSAPKSLERILNLSFGRDRYEEARTRGVSIDAHVTLLPDAQSLHVVVHDVWTGNTGSIAVPASRLRAITGKL